MEIATGSCVPEINWSITSIANTTIIPFTSFAQPGTSVLRLEPFLLEPGEYIVALEVTFPSVGSDVWINDFLAMQVLLPELVTHIAGGDYVDVPHGGIVYVDATASVDPADNLTSLDSTPLTAIWSFAHYAHEPLDFDIFLKDVAKGLPTLLVGNTNYQVTTGMDYVLEVDTTLFPASSVAVVMFSLSRGSRQSSFIQAIRFIPNAVPMRIE